MTLHDAHCHFFSSRFFETLGRDKHPGRKSVSVAQITEELGCDPPGEPSELAGRWMAEFERNQVSRGALIASVPGDEQSVAEAVRAYPDSLVGFFMLNPTAPDAVERAGKALSAMGLRAVCLFPAMHGYRLDDECVVKVFEVVARNDGCVFVQCGYLSIEARNRLKLPSPFDLRLGDPLALARTATRFPTVPVVVPHFGAGFFREALMAAQLCPNIHFDTSSSNSWVRFVPGLTLTEVFRRALAVVGPERLIFGTDSSFFPPGWRRVIYGAQRTILDDLGVERSAAEQIFGGNFDRIFPR